MNGSAYFQKTGCPFCNKDFMVEFDPRLSSLTLYVPAFALEKKAKTNRFKKPSEEALIDITLSHMTEKQYKISRNLRDEDMNSTQIAAELNVPEYEVLCALTCTSYDSYLQMARKAVH